MSHTTIPGNTPKVPPYQVSAEHWPTLFSLPLRCSPPLPGPLPRKFWAVVPSALIPESHFWEVWPGGAHKSMVGTQERSPSGTLTGSCFSTALSNLAKEYAS